MSVNPIIRPAGAGEVEALAGLVCEFAAEVLPDRRPHVPTIARTLAALIDNPRGYVAILDDGAASGLLAGIAAPSIWAPVLVAEELIWWIAPRRRGRFAGVMLDHFEAWAAAIGAGATGLSHTGKSAAALYERRGYERAETKYLRLCD